MTQITKPVPGKTTFAVYGVLFAAFAACAIAKETGYIDNVSAKRAVGMIFGLMMIVTGNFLPKLIHASSQSPALLKSRRLTGWLFVLTGAILIIALSLLPATHVPLWTALIGLGGFLAVGLNAALANLSAARHPGLGAKTGQVHSPAVPRGTNTWLSAMYILHAIGWVFAMFLADIIWGDKSMVWMLVGFTIANSVLALTYKAWSKPEK
tara:strand:+ start:490 stop:1116 length:627 start_codon:yes stop_codon:yes gene_type:complete